jgi:hypothetical protein
MKQTKHTKTGYKADLLNIIVYLIIDLILCSKVVVMIRYTIFSEEKPTDLLIFLKSKFVTIFFKELLLKLV